MLRQVLLFICLLVAGRPVIASLPTTIITPEGQTVGIPPDMRGAKTIVIEITGAATDAEYELAYEFTDALRTPGDLPDRAATIKPVAGKPHRFELPVPDKKVFARYEVRKVMSKAGDTTRSERARVRRDQLQDEVDQRKVILDGLPAARDLAKLNKEIAELEAQQAGLTDAAAAIERRISAVDAEINLIKEVESERTIPELRRLLEDKRRIAAEKERVTSEQAPLGRTIAAAKARRIPLTEKLAQRTESHEIAERETEIGSLTQLIDSADPSVTVLRRIKQGFIATGPRERIVYYAVSLVTRDPAVTMVPRVSVERIGAFPILHTGDNLIVAILNDRDAEGFPKSYSASLVVTAGTPTNIEAIRPVFAGPESAAVERTRVQFDTELPYRDVPFVIEKRFEGHEKLELTISGLVRVVTKDESEIVKGETTITHKEETKSFAFVDKAQLPPVKKFYRYNLNTGVVYSGLEEREFTKVRTQLDDPLTTDVNESRYRINEDRSPRNVIPMASFTFYWKPVDIESPPAASERWPQPTLGFGANQPLKNILLGFTQSLTRNVQLTWGLHRGTQKELVVRDDVAEDRDATAPVTRERSKQSFFVGLSFNLNILTKLLPAAGS